jgi:hypothetical protein
VALVRTQKTPFFIVTAVKTSNLTLKDAVFWDVTQCGSCKKTNISEEYRAYIIRVT